MNMMDGQKAVGSIGGQFDRAAAKPAPRNRKPKRPPPFSIRFTDEERAQLRRDAGTLSLAAYIRLKLLCEDQSPPPRKKLSKKKHSPSAELAVLGQLLGTIGKSEIASSLSDIAGAAKIGALPVSPELEQELHEACVAIQHMRRELIAALGVKPQDGP
ncbi:MAG: hypothetical protein Kilf2KO_28420 [Rhodospirillales bacterium]